MTNEAEEITLPPEGEPAQAKAGPGRPRGSKTASKSRPRSSSGSSSSAARPDRNNTRPDRALNKSEVDGVRADIAGALLGVNMLLAAFVPALALDQGDMRASDIVPQGNEVEKLTDALVSEVENTPSLRAWVRKAGQISPHMKLALAVGSILVTRLGVLFEGPRESDGANGDQQPTDADGGRSFAPPARMAPGPAHGGDWDNGQRQVNADGSPRAESAG